MSTKNENVVYFILNPKYNIIKIGVSLDPFERLNAFKSIYGPQLNLLGFVKGGIEYEKKLHSIFKEYRIPLGMFDKFRRINSILWMYLMLNPFFRINYSPNLLEGVINSVCLKFYAFNVINVFYDYLLF